MREVWEAPDPASRLRAYARAVRRIHDGAARMFRVLEQASASEADLVAAFAEAMHRRRLGVTGSSARSARPASSSRLGTETAIDITWTLNGHEVYLNLVDRCAWTSDFYAEWLGHTLVSLLLPNR